MKFPASSCAVLLMSFICTAPLAQSDTNPIDVQQLAVSAEATGRAIYRHDRAAELATDVARKNRGFRRDKRIRGWVSEELDDAVAIVFLDGENRAIYRARVHDSGAADGLEALDEPMELTGELCRAALARELAMSVNLEGCSDSYNTVVLPDRTREDAFQVYLLPGTTRHNIVPIGGTYRVNIQGNQITAQRGYTRSCLVLEKSKDSAGLIMTHLLDDQPTEIHVYRNLWADIPFYVGTKSGMWKVVDGRIQLVEQR